MTAATPPALAWKVRNADRQPLQVAQARLLDRVRITIRARHYSHSTEKAYVQWIRRFVLFHGKRHPAEMGGPEVSRYLSHLATVGRVSRTIEELLGHRDVSTTMIYTHVLNRGG
ncbi:MAG: phage integrase N-terminal SAM-like domain-containing protein, partial [Candidatus Eisenbacteria bacterium]|nr:phage integrase N-terminal SAM-like domain-containing protein [Candidatus Eisenbacteria bacterium]